MPPHTREWDGVRKLKPSKRPSSHSSAVGATKAASVRAGGGAADSANDDKPVAADGEWDNEDLEHLVDELGEPLELPGLRMAGRTVARAAPHPVPEDRIREWHDADGEVIAVGWLGSRLNDSVWIRTAKGDSIRVEVDALGETDQEYLDKL